MTHRRRSLWLCALCFFCHALVAAPPAETSPAMRLWEQGQEALVNGRTDEAIQLYSRSLQVDPKLSRNLLGLAAAYVSRGEEIESCRWLARYLEAEPGHHVVRLHYADLLLRLGKKRDGRAQLERFIADIQERDDLARAHLIDCHTKLVEIAEESEDEYGEHLNRGIGLYLLACEREQLGEGSDAVSAEALLCRAAAELGLARMSRPDEARPCWYLHQVWSRLAQHHPAMRWLRAAEAAAPFSYLTPAEQRGLRLACRQVESEERHCK